MINSFKIVLRCSLLLTFLCCNTLVFAQIFIPDEDEGPVIAPTQIQKLEPNVYAWVPNLPDAGAAFVLKIGDSLVVWGGLLHDEECQRFSNALKMIFPNTGLAAFIFQAPTAEAYLLTAFLARAFKIGRFIATANQQSYWEQHGAAQFSKYLQVGGKIFNYYNIKFDYTPIVRRQLLKINGQVIDLIPQKGGAYGCGLGVFLPQWGSYFSGWGFNNMVSANNYGSDFLLWQTDLTDLKKLNPNRVIDSVKGEVYNMFQVNYFIVNFLQFTSNAKLAIKKGMAVDEFIKYAMETIPDLRIPDFNITLPLLYAQLRN